MVGSLRNEARKANQQAIVAEKKRMEPRGELRVEVFLSRSG
jgi:hypothetical protein